MEINRGFESMLPKEQKVKEETPTSILKNIFDFKVFRNRIKFSLEITREGP